MVISDLSCQGILCTDPDFLFKLTLNVLCTKHEIDKKNAFEMIGLKPMPRKKANTFITLASVELQKETNWKELLPARVDKNNFICEACYEENPKTISKCT